MKKSDGGKILQNPHDNAYVWQLKKGGFSRDWHKIGDGLKDLENIFQMGTIWHF